MKWTFKQINIIDEPADVLICSANYGLNLSGGVGADLLARYGTKMQKALHEIVATRTPHYIKQGEVIPYSDETLPYKAILHAVAIDGFYDSSPQVIEEITKLALQISARDYQAKKVTLTALATGFGHLSLTEFANGIQPLISENFPPIEEVCICLTENYRIQELSKYLQK